MKINTAYNIAQNGQAYTFIGEKKVCVARRLCFAVVGTFN